MSQNVPPRLGTSLLLHQSPYIVWVNHAFIYITISLQRLPIQPFPYNPSSTEIIRRHNTTPDTANWSRGKAVLDRIFVRPTIVHPRQQCGIDYFITSHLLSSDHVLIYTNFILGYQVTLINNEPRTITQFTKVAKALIRISNSDKDSISTSSWYKLSTNEVITKAAQQCRSILNTLKAIYYD